MSGISNCIIIAKTFRSFNDSLKFFYLILDKIITEKQVNLNIIEPMFGCLTSLHSNNVQLCFPEEIYNNCKDNIIKSGIISLELNPNACGNYLTLDINLTRLHKRRK